jgi:FkbM family methyltransferase
VAFEADKRNFNNLSANIYLNQLDLRISARHIGVSDRAGEVAFLVNKGNSTGTSRILETAPGTTKFDLFEEAVIKVDVIDSLLAELKGQSVYMKVDVEGHEKAVIAGATSFFKANRVVLQVEILSDGEQIIEWLGSECGLRLIENIGSDYFFSNTQ